MSPVGLSGVAGPRSRAGAFACSCGRGRRRNGVVWQEIFSLVAALSISVSDGFCDAVENITSEAAVALDIIDLRESNAFLNILFDNIPAVVLVADKNLEIQEINDAYQSLFGQDRASALGVRCGNALKCSFASAENKRCGETSHCSQCQLRGNVLATMIRKIPADKEKFVHTFFVNGVAEERHFELTTRQITFRGEEMALLILYDVTDSERQKFDLLDKQKKIDESLRAAGTVQHCLLPRALPAVESVEFAWKFRPCDAIGGDILNAVPLDAAHIGLYVVDVAGHGAPSAMISVLVYQLMNPHTGILLDAASDPARIRDPEEVLDILDKEFPLKRFGRHFTIVYAVLDLASGAVTYSNAGHCPPILLTREGSFRTLDVSGTVIGLGAMPFGQETVVLSPGDKVVLCSDGVEEMRNPAQEFFGEARLRETLLALREASVAELVQGLYDGIVQFAAGTPPADDCSILAFVYRG